MVSLSHYIILPLCTAIFFFFLNKRRRRRRRAKTSQKRLPPSPPKLPVVGNLHQLGSFPHRSLQSLSRRYGPLMLLHFGGVPVVVASSAEAAREIMKNQDLIFSNRPKQIIPGKLFYGHRDVAFSPYGEYWRQVRSICVLQLLSNKMVQSYRLVRQEETSAMVDKIMNLRSSSSSSSAAAAAAAVNLSEVLTCMTNDVICRVALGKKYGEGVSFKKIFAEFQELLGMIPLWEYIPWLKWTRRFDGVDERVERAAKAIDEFLERVIQEHRGRERREKDGCELDFVDILLEFQRENEKGSSRVEDDTVKALILDMFAAGTDTTSTALEWTMAEIIRNPTAMKILQKEVREVKGEIEEEDLEKMPYLKAVMKESLRLHAPVPLLVPRELTKDTKVLGYDVASGTHVFINAWAIARDPSSWKDPDEFRPERFLETNVDYRGLHFELIPFGAGRRGCPGIAFAAAVNELALAKLVQKFDFELANGGKLEELDLSEAGGLTIHKRLPLLVMATPHVVN